jgi:hypothetical protein
MTTFDWSWRDRGRYSRNDRARVAFRGSRDAGEKVVALCEVLHETWFGSAWRARIPDGERMDAKRRRTARGVRLLVHMIARDSTVSLTPPFESSRDRMSLADAASWCDEEYRRYAARPYRGESAAEHQDAGYRAALAEVAAMCRSGRPAQHVGVAGGRQP